MILAVALPALLRWPLVLCPLYGAVVAVVLVVLFLAWRDGQEPSEKSRERGGKGLRLVGRWHR